MDQRVEVKNEKKDFTDSTTTCRLEILNEMQTHLIRKESDCFIQTEINIKMEPQEDKSEISVIAVASYELCPNYDVKIETDEPIVKIECKDLLDDIMEDPLDVSSQKKDNEEHLSSFESKTKTKNKKRESKRKENKNLTSVEQPKTARSAKKNQLLELSKQLDENKNYTCLVCNKVFNWKNSLVRHYRIHTGERPFKCHICMKAYSEKGNLDKHMLVHTGEKRFMCDICKKVFKQKSHRNNHMLIHSGVKPFSCSECNKSFAHKPELIRHKRIHTGEKPYVCDLCDKAFTVEVNLLRHRRLHSGEKPYSCDLCHKLFADKSNLNQHKKTHKN